MKKKTNEKIMIALTTIGIILFIVGLVGSLASGYDDDFSISARISIIILGVIFLIFEIIYLSVKKSLFRDGKEINNFCVFIADNFLMVIFAAVGLAIVSGWYYIYTRININFGGVFNFVLNTVGGIVNFFARYGTVIMIIILVLGIKYLVYYHVIKKKK